MSNATTADPIQDIYLRSLRDYKAPPEKPGDAEQHVHKFAVPSGFKSPEESNLANELSAYQSQTVEVEGQGATEHTPAQEHGQQDWFEELPDYEAEDKAAAGGGGH